MTDRQATLDGLSTWLQQNRPNCKFRTAPKTTTIDTPASGWNPEHGPFGGSGFLDDLFFASQAQDAFIGVPGRSSTALVLELVEYRRQVVQASGQEPLQVCDLPFREEG